MHHVIIGGGPAATNAIETIREFDGGRSSITLVSDEPAHSRMALPYWLAGSIPEAHTHTGDAAYFARLDVATRFGVRVAAVDPQGRTVRLGDGSTLEFDDLLIATGSSPLTPAIPGADEHHARRASRRLQGRRVLQHAVRVGQRPERLDARQIGARDRRAQR